MHLPANKNYFRTTAISEYALDETDCLSRIGQPPKLTFNMPTIGSPAPPFSVTSVSSVDINSYNITNVNAGGFKRLQFVFSNNAMSNAFYKIEGESAANPATLTVIY